MRPVVDAVVAAIGEAGRKFDLRIKEGDPGPPGFSLKDTQVSALSHIRIRMAHPAQAGYNSGINW